MVEINSYKCDVCGKMKETTNRWYKGYLINEGPLGIGLIEAHSETVGVMVVPWDIDTLSVPLGSHLLPKPNAHLCGQEHALQWASKQLKG
jgi:hypothetical protein